MAQAPPIGSRWLHPGSYAMSVEVVDPTDSHPVTDAEPVAIDSIGGDGGRDRRPGAVSPDFFTSLIREDHPPGEPRPLYGGPR